MHITYVIIFLRKIKIIAIWVKIET